MVMVVLVVMLVVVILIAVVILIFAEGRSAFKILTNTSTGKRPLGRPRRRCKDNIRVSIKEKSISTRNSAGSSQDRDYWRVLVNAALNLRVL